MSQLARIGIVFRVESFCAQILTNITFALTMIPKPSRLGAANRLKEPCLICPARPDLTHLQGYCRSLRTGLAETSVPIRARVFLIH